MRTRFHLNRALTGICLLLLAMATLLLTACGGGGNNTATLSGTAASGAPMAGYVFVTDIHGIQVNTAIATDGSYSIDLTGMNGPFLVRAVPNAGATQYSWASGANQTVNVTPLTTLAVLLANGNADLAALSADWAAHYSALTGAAIANAQARINANFATALSNAGLDPTTYNFIASYFAANHTGFDAVLDHVAISFTPGSSWSYAVNIDNAAFAFDINIDVSGIHIGGGSGGGSTGGGGGSSGACTGGAISMTFNLVTGKSAPFNDGQEVCFSASSSSLAFSGKTLGNPTSIQPSPPYSTYYFLDSATNSKYEVVFNGSDLYEINVLDTANNDDFVGQFRPTSSGSGSGGSGGGSGGAIAGTWKLTVTGTAFGQTIPQQITNNIVAANIPVDQAAFGSSAEVFAKSINGSVNVPGANVQFAISNLHLTFTPSINGQVGDTIAGAYQADMHITGTVTANNATYPIDLTGSVNLTFNYERIN